ncbi:MAG: hypothetical protein GX643_01685, partial [Acidimicrobiales bacterium]|nr:hypothetical protein [Acidimicrobiales bacterium]
MSPKSPSRTPHGSWRSPITASALVQGAASVSEVRVDGTDIWWNEQRPSEGGRHQLVRCRDDGPGGSPSRQDLFEGFDPSGAGRNWNARTAVMEYGGGAWNVRGGLVVFADWSDQRLHRTRLGEAPTPITPEPPASRAYRWSEPTWLDDAWLVCVREDHSPERVASHGEAVNELVAVPVDGSAVDDPSRVKVLVSGPDFVHSPVVHGRLLVWIQWDHPSMPWDGSTLVVGLVEREGGVPVGVTSRAEVAGGPQESVVQPGFEVTGDLVFCTDRTGWWNPWVIDAASVDQVVGEAGSAPEPFDGRSFAEPVLAGGGVDVEIGGPLWVGGLRWWADAGDGRLVVSATRDGSDHLAVIGTDGTFAELPTRFSEVVQVVPGPAADTVVIVGATPTTEAGPHLVALTPEVPGAGVAGSARVAPLRPSRDLGMGEEWFSVARHVSFPSGPGVGGDRVAHALFYAPNNPSASAPTGELPPLVVMIHGGPTSAARNRLDLAKQFWTSRGFAVVDVNYGGSTGY